MLPEPVTYPQAPPLRLLPEAARSATGRTKRARMLSSITLGSVVLIILIVVVGMALGIWRFNVIDTGSMRPTLNPGDVAVLTPESTNDLKQGQIVAFHPPGEPRLTGIHRVVSVHRVPNGVIIQTKGDANNATDQ